MGLITLRNNVQIWGGGVGVMVIALIQKTLTNRPSLFPFEKCRGTLSSTIYVNNRKPEVRETVGTTEKQNNGQNCATVSHHSLFFFLNINLFILIGG